jgi:hypothetical protein
MLLEFAEKGQGSLLKKIFEIPGLSHRAISRACSFKQQNISLFELAHEYLGKYPHIINPAILKMSMALSLLSGTVSDVKSLLRLPGLSLDVLSVHLPIMFENRLFENIVPVVDYLVQHDFKRYDRLAKIWPVCLLDLIQFGTMEDVEALSVFPAFTFGVYIAALLAIVDEEVLQTAYSDVDSTDSDMECVYARLENLCRSIM